VWEKDSLDLRCSGIELCVGRVASRFRSFLFRALYCSLGRTFLPAYLPRLMMATRPTLRTVKGSVSTLHSGSLGDSPRRIAAVTCGEHTLHFVGVVEVVVMSRYRLNLSLRRRSWFVWKIDDALCGSRRNSSSEALRTTRSSQASHVTHPHSHLDDFLSSGGLFRLSVN